jgi:hypothetical protein
MMAALTIAMACAMAWGEEPKQQPGGAANPGQPAAAPGAPNAGQPGGGGPGGGGPMWGGGRGFGGFGGGGGGITGMIRGFLGIDFEDPKAPVKLDALPLGIDKRLVINVPVGGVDNPAANTNGWKMESIFKLTEEQQKAVDALREEYKAQQKKLDEEVLAAQKAVAEKVKDLRLKYEQRANDILTGNDKTTKEKLDALARETITKNMAVVTEMMPMFDGQDMGQGFAVVRAIREKISANAKTAEEKLLELAPADGKAKIQDILKQQQNDRDRMNRWGGGGGRGRGGPGGGGGPGGNTPVKPPTPPEADKKADF